MEEGKVSRHHFLLPILSHAVPADSEKEEIDDRSKDEGNIDVD
jgi:hypothetical protein